MTRYACARLNSNEIPAHISLPKAFSAPYAAEHVSSKSTLVCVLQWHLSTQHKQNCILRMASRFLTSSSLASIVVFSSWYLFCGAAQFKLHSDSLYNLFSAMICFSTSGVSGKMCTCSCPDNKTPIPIHSLICVMPTAENAFAWETRAPSLLSVNFQLPKSLNMQEYLNWNFHMPRNIDYNNTKIMLVSLESSLKEILYLPYWISNAEMYSTVRTTIHRLQKLSWKSQLHHESLS